MRDTLKTNAHFEEAAGIAPLKTGLSHSQSLGSDQGGVRVRAEGCCPRAMIKISFPFILSILAFDLILNLFSLIAAVALKLMCMAVVYLIWK